MTSDISVIIPTYNRAESLDRTMRGMVVAAKGDLSVEFVIIDNGSNDRTKSVVESFSNKLSVRYLFEPKSGKNRALNCALENLNLGNIVVFTDDDVDVSPSWLVSIRSVCDRWPNHSVFGGRIDVIFPIKDLPERVNQPFIRKLAFAQHSYSDKESLYERGKVPYGPNYWVRRRVFDNGRRFNEAIGPHPTSRTLGDETSFLLDLLKDGYEIVYSPTAVVGHRIQPEILRVSAICLRAYQIGRGAPYINGLPQLTLLKQHPIAWRLYRYGGITWNSLKLLFSTIFSSNEKRLVNCVKRIIDLGYQIEAMRLAKNCRGDAWLKK